MGLTKNQLIIEADSRVECPMSIILCESGAIQCFLNNK